MRTRTKIRVDRIVGQPLSVLLNLLARVLGKLLRRDHSLDPSSVRTVVVAKFVGMGSIIQSTPLVHALHEHFPGARIVYLTSAANQPLMRHLEGVDEVIYVEEGSVVALLRSTLRAALVLMRRGVDLHLDLEVYSSYATILSLVGLARNRAGFYRTSARFKQATYTHLVFFNTSKPIRHLYLQLGRALGVPVVDDRLLPLRISEADQASFRQTWKRIAPEHTVDDVIVVNANASDLLEERRWPLPSFATVIEALAARGHPVALIGSPGESAYVMRLFDRLSPEARRWTVPCAGELSLAEALVLMQHASCVLTNDSGPMHMAFALRRPTVCLFGPVDPRHYGTRQPEVEFLYKGVFCSPCLHHVEEPPCAGDNVCMQRISPEEVLDAIERRLESAPATGLDAERHDAGERQGKAPLGTLIRDSILGVGLAPCVCCQGIRFRYLFHRESLRFITCVTCGLQRIDPPPTTEAMAEIYQRTYYDAWGLESEPERTARMKRASFARLLRQYEGPVGDGRRLLDFGAATGFLMQVAEESGYLPYGIEINPFGAEAIATRFGSGRVFCGEAEQAKFSGIPGEAFDVALMTDYLEHVRRPDDVLRAAWSFLKPGGRLILTTPDTSAWSRRLMGGNWPHYKAEHLFYFSRSNLQRLLEACGFELEAVSDARKVLSLRYVARVLQGYPHWLLTPLSKGAGRLLPDALLDGHFSLPRGELELSARKIAR